MAVEIVQLQRNQMREAGEVLGRAFYDDPLWMWVLPDDSKRTRVLPWAMTVMARSVYRYREVHTTADKVEGAAIWVPPGRYPLSVLGMMLAGWALAPLRLGVGAFRRMMGYSNLVERLHRRDTPSRHWYLMVLGVDPSRQGRGVGGALMQPVLARADAEDLPCYLETEKQRNVHFYEGHGFDVVVESDAPGGGPHFWTMRREPRG